MRDNSREAVAARKARRRVSLEDELGRMLALLRAHAGVRRVILFGSLARGESGAHSDLDLIVIQDTAKRFLDRLDEFYRLLSPRVATDILVYTPGEWSALATSRPLIRRAQREGRVVYESEAA